MTSDKQNIKNALPITEVLEHYGCKPNDSHLNWSCSFHDSKNKISLSVDTISNICCCVNPGCKLNGKKGGGDIFNVIAAGENLDIQNDFTKILKKASELSGIPLENIDSNLVKEEFVKKQMLSFFFDYSKNKIKNNSYILDYICEKRNITKKDLSKLNLGYFPHDCWSDFKLNLFKNVKNSNILKYYDYNGKEKLSYNCFYSFLGRIIHPHFVYENLVYLTGEVTPKSITDSPKYNKLNTNMSLSGKSEPYLLNNLFEDHKQIVICEGYYDALTLELHGIPCITYGTCKVPTDFVSRYKKYLQNKEIIICFDNEENQSGTEGLIGLGNQFLKEKVENVFVCELERKDQDKVDIDEYFKPITSEKTKELKSFLENKIPFVEYRKRHLSEYITFNYMTGHLPRFESYKRFTGLVGDEYLLMLKISWLSIIGNCLKDTPIKIGSTYCDTRINLAIILNSGKGKLNLKESHKKLNNQVTETTSLHPEQLIGTVIKEGKGKNEEVKQIKGYFGDDGLILDEARKLFTNVKDDQIDQIRQNICLALDPIGRNEITKRLVKLGRENPLTYNAKCYIILFTQPCKIKKEVTEGGFIRRFFLINVRAGTDRSEKYRQRLSLEPSETYINQLQTYLRDSVLAQDYKPWKYQEGIEKHLIKFTNYLIEFGESHSSNGAKFTNKIYEQVMLDQLIKLSGIHSVINGNTPKYIDEYCVKLAYCDLLEIYHSMLNCIKDYCEDFYTFNVKSEDLQILDWLIENSAESQDSEISIDQLKEFIADRFSITKRTAGGWIAKLRNKGFVDSKQDGKHETKLWITKKGKNSLNSSFKQKPSKCGWYKAYNDFIKKEVNWYEEVDSDEK